MSNVTVTPYMATSNLVRLLRSNGWGELSSRDMQGVRNTLNALCDFVSDKTGIGKSTAFQISLHTGLSERWTRRCLHVLEDMGVIDWSRGDIYENKTRPSLFVVHKKVLCEMIKHAISLVKNIKIEYKAKVIARISKIRKSYMKSKNNSLSKVVQQELSDSQYLFTNNPQGVISNKDNTCTKSKPKPKSKNVVEKVINMAKGLMYTRFDPNEDLSHLVDKKQDAIDVHRANTFVDEQAQTLTVDELQAFNNSKAKAVMFKNLHKNCKADCECTYVRTMKAFRSGRLV